MTTRAAISSRLPVRIQRKRTKGWKMPENTVYVGRGTRWGNPYSLVNEEGFPLIEAARGDWEPCRGGWVEARKRIVQLYRERCIDGLELTFLRGKDLACWCPLVDEFGAPYPCHADVLLDMANK